MFKISTVDQAITGVLNPLVADYLARDERLRFAYAAQPDLEGFASSIAGDPYTSLDRQRLVDILLQQHHLVENGSNETLGKIRSLSNPGSYAVVTGHQLCLFTGPLYFIYKIISTINLTEQLCKQFPGSEFIPVYWMAGEDHDFAEVDHFHVGGATIRWEDEQKGPVGKFNTSRLKDVVPVLSGLLRSKDKDENPNSAYLISLFERAYLQHETLDLATRYLVNELFGRFGLVTINGDDPAFKRQFSESFANDIFSQEPYQQVTQTISDLNALGYEAQVNPRPVNCFYFEKGLRTRIEKTGEKFRLTDGGRTFSEDQMQKMVAEHPEKLSPNVVLRPLYQQTILPSIAYVGGPGELAYWLEYKRMFDTRGIHFPILVPRNFVTVVDQSILNKIDKLGFKSEDFFSSETQLVKDYQERTGAVIDLEAEKSVITELFARLGHKVSAVDKTLEATVRAELQRSLNGLEQIAGKANKALKLKNELSLKQLAMIRQRFFPEGMPQERYENFSNYYWNHGEKFISFLKEHLDPFIRRHYLLEERD